MPPTIALVDIDTLLVKRFVSVHTFPILTKLIVLITLTRILATLAYKQICGLYIITSALIVLSHNVRTVLALILKKLQGKRDVVQQS